MRASMAYFAGAGTVIVAIAAGLGGGFMISDIMSPQGTRTPGKLEQHVAAQQVQPSPQPSSSPSNSTTASAQAPVPYLAATQAATTPTIVAPAPSNSPQPTTSVEQSAPPAAAKTETATSIDPAKPAQAPVAQPVSRDQASSPDNAYAKAREADLKQLEARKKAEQKTEQKAAERRQQWAARRQQQHDAERQQGDGDRGPGEFIVRRDDRDDMRRYDRDDESDRPDFGRPMRLDFPRILFGQD
jgi:hypothetical protein